MQKVLAKEAAPHKINLENSFTRLYSDTVSNKSNSNSKIEDMLKLLIDKSDAASNQIKKVETTINDKMDKLVEFFPKKLEVDKCFKLQTKYTNKTVQSSINSMVNIMNDSIRPFIDQRALVAFDEGIKDSCKKHVQFYSICE